MSRLNSLFLAALASSIFTLPVLAQESKSEVTKPEAPAGRYELKNRSSFTTNEFTRPPFWPIGHVKLNRNSGASPIAPVPTTKLVPEMFSVTSILLGNPSLAVINGRAYGEGEYLRQGRGARGYAAVPDPRLRVRVIRIVDGNVTLQSADGQSVVVQMRRDELSERKPDLEAEMLLNNQ